MSLSMYCIKIEAQISRWHDNCPLNLPKNSLIAKTQYPCLFELVTATYLIAEKRQGRKSIVSILQQQKRFYYAMTLLDLQTRLSFYFVLICIPNDWQDSFICACANVQRKKHFLRDTAYFDKCCADESKIKRFYYCFDNINCSYAIIYMYMYLYYYFNMFIIYLYFVYFHNSFESFLDKSC